MLAWAFCLVPCRMRFDPLDVIGSVFTYEVKDGEAKIVHLGTCFAFRSAITVITAAHVVREEGRSYRVFFPRTNVFYEVSEVVLHPEADIALLRLAPMEVPGVEFPEEAFWDGVSNYSLGEDLMSFGFPSDGPSEDAANTPTPRLFKGHIQRIFNYNAHEQWSYLAAELSIPAPGGLSGAPLFRLGAQEMVVGLVTANAESFAITDSIEEMDSSGNRLRIESRRVLNYGVGLLLAGVADWLKEQVADDKPWVLRQAE